MDGAAWRPRRPRPTRMWSWSWSKAYGDPLGYDLQEVRISGHWLRRTRTRTAIMKFWIVLNPACSFIKEHKSETWLVEVKFLILSSAYHSVTWATTDHIPICLNFEAVLFQQEPWANMDPLAPPKVIKRKKDLFEENSDCIDYGTFKLPQSKNIPKSQHSQTPPWWRTCRSRRCGCWTSLPDSRLQFSFTLRLLMRFRVGRKYASFIHFLIWIFEYIRMRGQAWPEPQNKLQRSKIHKEIAGYHLKQVQHACFRC